MKHEPRWFVRPEFAIAHVRNRQGHIFMISELITEEHSSCVQSLTDDAEYFTSSIGQLAFEWEVHGDADKKKTPSGVVSTVWGVVSAVAACNARHERRILFDQVQVAWDNRKYLGRDSCHPGIYFMRSFPPPPSQNMIERVLCSFSARFTRMPTYLTIPRHEDIHGTCGMYFSGPHFFQPGQKFLPFLNAIGE